MITKGIVEELLENNKARVRLPIYNRAKDSKDATLTENLDAATICTLPNSANTVNVNDIVFVGFEDNDVGKPIILGHLAGSENKSTHIDLHVRLFTTQSTTKLSDQTWIGDVTPEELQSLIGVKSSIQAQLNSLSERIKALEGGNG